MISIHALLAESDSPRAAALFMMWIFLSTLSLRRATKGGGLKKPPPFYFYPRSPCGERHDIYCIGLNKALISIHALLAESDVNGKNLIICKTIFLSTLSLRRATKARSKRINRNITFLSTLSLRRATCLGHCQCTLSTYFYPRSPCGERRLPCIINSFTQNISIHALLAESDRCQ